MHTAKIEIRECIQWSLTTGQKPWKIINRQAQKVVAVAYRRWSFTRGSNCKALTGKVLVFWIGGRTWRFDCTRKKSIFVECRRRICVLLELVLRRTQNFTIIDQENPKIEQIFIGDHMTTGYIMINILTLI